MMIGMGLFWIAVVVGIVWLARGGIDLRRRPPEETALTILDRRFAEGALSLDDYHRRRDVLTGAAKPHLAKGARSAETERREQ
jgi:putative membrane protein